VGKWAGVVLAAGKGLRMKSRLPKMLHPVCGREMLALAVEALKDAGVKTVFVLVPPKPQEFRRVLGTSVRYVTQEKPLGTGHALLQAIPFLPTLDHVLVTSGDVPLIRSTTLSRMISLHTENSAAVTLLTSRDCPPRNLGRVLRDGRRRVLAIVEEREATPLQKRLKEVNSGIYCFDAKWLFGSLSKLSPSASGEIYVTDLVAMASKAGLNIATTSPEDEWEIFGINDRVQLAQADSALRQRIRLRCMEQGVTLIDPSSIYIDASVEIGRDTVVHPNTHLVGKTKIYDECTIGPNSIIRDSHVGAKCRILNSVVEEAELKAGVSVGPFSHIRSGSRIESDVYIGNYVEIKKSSLGQGTKVGHFSYIGDATLGANVNIGAGTVTCNFDGRRKHRTVIGDDVFIGSDTMLVAPVTIGDRSSTGAGAVITKDVPPDSLAVGVPAKLSSKKKRAD